MGLRHIFLGYEIFLHVRRIDAVDIRVFTGLLLLQSLRFFAIN